MVVINLPFTEETRGAVRPGHYYVREQWTAEHPGTVYRAILRPEEIFAADDPALWGVHTFGRIIGPINVDDLASQMLASSGKEEN